MGTKTVIGGIASEYDDQILWIERAEVFKSIEFDGVDFC